MNDAGQKQGTILETARSDYLGIWIENFLFDRKSQNMTPGTLQYYRVKLKTFSSYCDGVAISQVNQVTSNELRRFLVWLEETGHNPGGRHAVYRAVKTFLRWYEDEAEPENWKNPILKVKPPRVDIEPLEPVTLETIGAMADRCEANFTGKRDRAILLALLDTGTRAQEFLNMDLSDLDLVRGAILIRRSKARKPREVYIGRKTKKVLRSYLKTREDNCPALWITDEGERMKYFGLRSMIVRRANQTGIHPPSLHSFRRGCAIQMWRNGEDLVTIARYLGHRGLATIERYLKQTPADLLASHQRSGPVDHG